MPRGAEDSPLKRFLANRSSYGSGASRNGRVSARYTATRRGNCSPLTAGCKTQRQTGSQVFERRAVFRPAANARIIRTVEIQSQKIPHHLRTRSKIAGDQDLCHRPPTGSLRRIGSPAASSRREKIDGLKQLSSSKIQDPTPVVRRLAGTKDETMTGVFGVGGYSAVSSVIGRTQAEMIQEGKIPQS